MGIGHPVILNLCNDKHSVFKFRFNWYIGHVSVEVLMHDV